MAEEEQDKPRRRRLRRSRGEEGESASAGEPTPNAEAAPTDPDSVEPSSEDIEAEEATEVVLEADDEAEEPAAEVEAPETEAEASETGAEVEAPETEAEAPETEPEAEAPQTAEPERPASPAPSRRRRGERPAGPPPVVRAQAKYVRSSARKARLVCDHIRGKSVEEARAILALTPRAIARDWSKLLESAVANAEHNHELVGEDLYVKAIRADEGPTIKRFRPRAMGRATRIRKRTSHLTILLTPKE
jgi:ribosomal protein L22